MTAFEKRLKRRFIGRRHDFFAVCAPGLEQICRSELEELLDDDAQLSVTKGGVSFSGKPDAAYLANLCLGSASRILMRLADFRASSFSELEKKLSQIDWEIFLPSHPELTVRVSSKKSRLFHSHAIVQRIRNSVVDRLGENFGKAGDNESSLQTLFVRLNQDRCHISLDMSGELLFKRGIKSHVTKAPLRETLAFSLLWLTRFSPGDILVDPMCGSGTFSLEAARIQAGIPPGYFRDFAFQSWPGFRPEHFAYLKKQRMACGKSDKTTEKSYPRIFASDGDAKAVETAQVNVDSHEFLSSVQVRHKDFFDILPFNPGIDSEKGVILLNPPYGKRLSNDPDQKAQKAFFREIGIKLRRDFSGWRVGVVCPSASTKKALGFKGFSSIRVFHGGLWVYLTYGSFTSHGKR